VQATTLTSPRQPSSEHAGRRCRQARAPSVIGKRITWRTEAAAVVAAEAVEQRACRLPLPPNARPSVVGERAARRGEAATVAVAEVAELQACWLTLPPGAQPSVIAERAAWRGEAATFAVAEVADAG